MKAQRILLLLCLVLFANIGRAQKYRIVDLGAGLESNSYAQAINNKGQVVGYWLMQDGAHGFLYSAGEQKDLGNLGGTNIFALSINDAGQIVGVAETSLGMEAFLYQNGLLTNLGTLGGMNSYAYGINNRGQVVGYVDTSAGALAFVYSDGSKVEIGNLGGTNSFGYGLNALLQVAGASLTAENGTLHAFFWQTNWIKDLNQLVDKANGWELREARGINDEGQIVGSGVLNGQEHAFFFNAGVVTDIGILPGGTNSYAFSVNNGSQVVGTSSSRNGPHAFVWNAGTLHDLNDLLQDNPGWNLREAAEPYEGVSQ